MIKLRIYDTPNSLSYISFQIKRKHYLRIEILGKVITLYYGKNTKFIP